MREGSPADLTIRAAHPGDAAAIGGLMCELGYPTDQAEMKQRLETIAADPSFRTFVAVTGGLVCGMIGTTCAPSYEHNDCGGRIVALVVTESARRQGVARRLLKAAEEDFAQRKITRIALTTRLTRKGAHQFYEQQGYEQTGYRYVKELGQGR